MYTSHQSSVELIKIDPDTGWTADNLPVVASPHAAMAKVDGEQVAGRLAVDGHDALNV